MTQLSDPQAVQSYQVKPKGLKNLVKRLEETGFPARCGAEFVGVPILVVPAKMSHWWSGSMTAGSIPWLVVTSSPIFHIVGSVGIPDD